MNIGKHEKKMYIHILIYVHIYIFYSESPAVKYDKKYSL